MEGNSNEDFSNLDLTDFFDWEEFENNSKDDVEVNISVCICDIPSTEKLVECHSDACPTKFYHAACVGQPLDVEDWLCNLCKAEVVTEKDASQGHTSTANHQRPMPVKMKYPPKNFRKVNAAVLAPDIMGSAVKDVFSNELFKLKTPFAEKVVSTAREVDNLLSSPSFLKFAEETVSSMWRVANTLRGKVWTDKVKADMWCAFHRFRSSERTMKRWTSLLNELKLERDPDIAAFLLQHILEVAFGFLLKTVMETDMPEPSEDATPQPMETSEEQALRYCCGYVPFKLRKRYRKMRGNDIAATYVTILSSWADERDMDAESLLDYTEKWLQVQNRGGLFRVKDDVFCFFKAVEHVVRSNAHVRNIDNLQDVNLQKFLLNKMLCDKEILAKWQKITSNLKGECSLKLLTEVLQCYIKMRCESFIKVYLFIRKSSHGTVSKKAEKGLRKSLAT